MFRLALIATYRELVRLHTQLADEAARYKNEIQALLAVLFPEFSQVFTDPCRSTAIGILKLYPSAQAVAAAGVETLAEKLHELAPRNYGLQTAQQLVALAQHSASSGLAVSARSTSLKIRMSTSLSILRPTYCNWKGRSTSSWIATKGPKAYKVSLNLGRRR